MGEKKSTYSEHSAVNEDTEYIKKSIFKLAENTFAVNP